MGTLGAIFTSLDGESWSQAQIPVDYNDITNVDAVVYTGSRWIAFARVNTDSNAAIITTNVVDFDRVALPNVQEVQAAAYGAGLVVATGYFGFLVSEDEGQTWQEISYPSENNFLPPLAFGNGMFLAAQSETHNGGTITIQSSTDALNWNVVGTLTVGLITNMNFVNGLFYLIGTDSSNNAVIWSSATGATWTKIPISGPLDSSALLSSMAFGNNIYVLIPNTENMACFTSIDGTTFTTGGNLPGASGGVYEKVIFSDGLFVAITQQVFFVTSPGTISFSADGTTWQSTVATTEKNASLYDIVARL